MYLYISNDSVKHLNWFGKNKIGCAQRRIESLIELSPVIPIEIRVFVYMYNIETNYDVFVVQ